MSKKRKHRAAPSAAAVAGPLPCGHAQCDPGDCRADTRPPIVETDLPRRARAALADQAKALEALRRVTVGRLADLERRAGVVVGRPEEGPGESLADGWPTSLRRSPGMRGRATRTCSAEVLVAGVAVRCGEAALPGRTGCEAHSTEAEEDPGQLPPPPQADPVGELGVILAEGGERTDPTPDAVRRFYRELARATDAILSAVGLADALVRNPLFGRPGSMASCHACGRGVTGVGNDRMRNGYCPACDTAWRRACEAGPVDRRAFEGRRRDERRGSAA